MSKFVKWALLFLGLLGLFVFVRYKLAPKQASQDTLVEKADIPEEFWTFYRRFHTDSNYQLTRIHFPLDGIIKHETTGEKHNWDKASWKIQSKPKNLSSYTIQYDNYGSFIDEIIQDKSEHFRMLRRFSKNDTTWSLIFYEEMGPKIN